MGFHDRLEKLVGEKGVSAEEIAKVIGGVSDTTVWRWISGKGYPRFDQACKLAEYLGCTLNDLTDEPCATDAATQQDEASRLTPDEVIILTNIRDLGLSRAEVIRRLAGETGDRVAGGSTLVRTRDTSEESRQEERKMDEKRRLGFEKDSHAKAICRDDLPPVCDE